MKNRTRATAG